MDPNKVAFSHSDFIVRNMRKKRTRSTLSMTHLKSDKSRPLNMQSVM